MHARVAAIPGELLIEWIVLLLLGHIFEEIGDDVPKLVRLALAHDVARDPARILNVLLAIEDLPDSLRLLSGRVPEMHRENQRVAARGIVEDALGRGVGENAAVPIKLAVDTHGWEGGRQRA